MKIYRIINSVNGKIYIGQSSQQIETRWKQHCLLHGKCRALENAIKKYGVDAFSIEEIATAESQEELNRLERFWIANLNTVSPGGYNLSGGGEGAGVMHEGTKAIIRANARRPEHLARFDEMRNRPEVRAKQAANKIERWSDPATKARYVSALTSGARKPEAKARHRAALLAAFAKPEVKKKLAAVMAEIRTRPEVSRKRAESMRLAWAVPGAAEQRGAAISAAKSTPEAKARYAATNAKPEVKARRSAASTGRVVSAETRLKKSLAATGKKRGPYGPCKPRPAMAAHWADPEWKAAVLAKRPASLAAQLETLKATNALPETRARRSAAAAKWQAERKAA